MYRFHNFLRKSNKKRVGGFTKIFKLLLKFLVLSLMDVEREREEGGKEREEERGEGEERQREGGGGRERD